MDTTPRWQYRFDSYQSVYKQLAEAVSLSEDRPLSSLEQAGLIQRFCFTWEQAWKLLKDYLEASGVQLDTVTPKTVLRAAFAARLIADGEAWMMALEARNKMAHTYDAAASALIAEAIVTEFYPLLRDLRQTLR